jgi:hypothetical protein
MNLDSPIWDITDCAPVLTEEQIASLLPTYAPTLNRLYARLTRYYETADIIDAIIDGKFFALDWEQFVRDAVRSEG